MSRRIRLTPVLGVLLGMPALLSGQAADSGAFVITLGNDTLILEQYRITAGGTRIEGDLLNRRQVVTRRHYVLTLAPDGTASGLELTSEQPGTPGAKTARVTWTRAAGGDTTVTTLARGDSSRTFRVATPGGTLPNYGWSGTFFERYLARARPGGGAVHVTTLAPGNDQPTTVDVVRHAGDSGTILLDPDLPIPVRLDAAGHLLVADGSATTEKYVVRRVPSLDMTAQVKAFANRPVGTLSPPDSVQATVGGSSVKILYSRPSLRGRTAVGGLLVPYNAVWRTGANAATRITTTGDLIIAGARIPAGTYTLFTLPSAGGWKLIVSKQTKAPCQTAAQCADPNRRPLWGTDYSPDSDLVRVDMKVESTSPSAEQFTIGIAPQGTGAGNGGVATLWMTWEKTKASVPLAKP